MPRSRSLVLRDAAAYLPGVVVPVLTGVLGAVAYTRLFTPRVYGDYVIVVGSVMVGAAVGGQWLQQSLLRYGHDVLDDVESQHVFRRALYISLLIAVGLAVCVNLGLLLFARGAVAGDVGSLLALSSAAVALELLLRTQLTLLRVGLRPGVYSVANSTYSALGLLFSALIGALICRSAFGMLVGLVCAQLVTNVAFLGQTRAWFWGRIGDPRAIDAGAPLTLVRRYILFGLPMALWFIASQMNVYTDRFVLSQRLGTGATGVYTPSYSYASQVVMMVAMPLMMAIYPRLTRTFDGSAASRTAAAELLEKGVRAYLLGATGIAVIAAVVARPVVESLVGSAFRGGYVVVPYVLLGGFLWNLSMYTHKPLELAERTGAMAASLMASAAMGVVATWVLVGWFGIRGAAIGYALTSGVYLAASWIVGRRHLAWRFPLYYGLRCVGAGTTALAAGALVRALLQPQREILLIWIAILVSAASAAVSYALAAWALGLLPKRHSSSRSDASKAEGDA